MSVFTKDDLGEIRRALKVMKGMLDDCLTRMEVFGESNSLAYEEKKQESEKYALLIKKVDSELDSEGSFGRYHLMIWDDDNEKWKYLPSFNSKKEAMEFINSLLRG